MDSWRPSLSADGGPAYAQIVDALATGIERGELPRGSRLPTQRALAHRIGVGIGTVTRAYTAAEGLGLIEAVVGRGSFVSGAARAPQVDTVIDLSRNVAPIEPASAALRAGFAAIARRADLAARLDYAPEGGFEADRRAGAAWLSRTANLPDADPSRLIVTAGAQQAIAVALAALCRPGEALIVERATFNGVRGAAARAGLTLAPAAMDGEGLTPEALSRAARETGANVAYVQPFQNPTARVMGLSRRRDIIEAARRAGVTLIEDDLYGPHVADLGLPPLAALAPDQVAYISGLTKCLAPGLRTGYLIAPDRFRVAALEALRAISFGPPTLGAALGAQWIESGVGFDIFAAVRRELARRTETAVAMLAGLAEPVRQSVTTHLWLPMGELDAERVAGQALRAQVRVTPPSAPFPEGTAVEGLRICLGGAGDIEALRRGLEVLRAALQPGRALAENVV
jgi:DNA-binding transcriptional MocR family regulator